MILTLAAVWSQRQARKGACRNKRKAIRVPVLPLGLMAFQQTVWP